MKLFQSQSSYFRKSAGSSSSSSFVIIVSIVTNTVTAECRKHLAKEANSRPPPQPLRLPIINANCAVIGYANGSVTFTEHDSAVSISLSILGVFTDQDSTASVTDLSNSVGGLCVFTVSITTFAILDATTVTLFDFTDTDLSLDTTSPCCD